jgi:hypothetical protein
MPRKALQGEIHVTLQTSAVLTVKCRQKSFNGWSNNGRLVNSCARPLIPKEAIAR